MGCVNVYDDGDVVRLTGVFVDVNGTPVDPDEVYFSFRFNAGPVTTWRYGVNVQVVRESVGTYHADIDVSSKRGQTCYYRVYSRGNGQTAGESHFFVQPSSILG